MVVRKFVLAGLLAILFSGCGGNQLKFSERFVEKSVENTSLQIVNKKNGNARVKKQIYKFLIKDFNMNEPIFFSTQILFREWLAKNHNKKTELLVGYYKVKSGYKSMTWSDSVDHALCFGWIDGVRKYIDEYSYQIRFTPRQKKSVWSSININKIEKLIKKGLMQQAGIEIFNNRAKNKSYDYAFKKNLKLPSDFESQFKKNLKAWDYFESLAPSYKKYSIHWVISAVQDKTKIKRLQKLIASSELGTNEWKDSKYKKKQI